MDVTYEVTFEPFGSWVSTSEDGQVADLPTARNHAGDGELALVRVKDWAIDVAESAQAQGMDTFIVRIEREGGDGTVWSLVVAPGMGVRDHPSVRARRHELRGGQVMELYTLTRMLVARFLRALIEGILK